MPFADRDAAGIAALADPVRGRLYRYVCAQAEPVSREQAAEAMAIPVHRAKFHLDRLHKAGLLDIEYARLGDRSGPGAGRTSKLYRRTDGEIAVSLPDREYQLAGRMMADAIAASARSGTPVVDALDEIARQYGRTIAATEVHDSPASRRAAMQLVTHILSAHGYEPRADESRVVMANCPFHALAQAQTELVCRMNHALICGVIEQIPEHRPAADLEPADGRCCVVITEGAR